MKIFLICPVRIDTFDEKVVAEQAAIETYVKKLEDEGYTVHWPKRDTEQNDPSGGYEICRTNFDAMLNSDQIHIWYNEKSGGSKFDMGGLFMLVEMLNYDEIEVIIANRDEATKLDKHDTSFLKVIKHIAG